MLRGIRFQLATENFDRLGQIPFFVVGERQVEFEPDVVRGQRERGAILRDRLVEAPQFSQRRSEVGPHLDHVGTELNQFLVLADGQRIVALLLRRNSLAEELFGVGRLRCHAGGQG